MRSLIVSVCLAGCTHWTPIDAAQIDREEVLVVTNDHAYEMAARYVDGRVEGRPTRMWSVFECPDADDNDSPSALAARCKWTPLSRLPIGIRIRADVITDVRAERVSRPETVVFGLAVLGVIGIGLGIAYAVALSNVQSH